MFFVMISLLFLFFCVLGVGKLTLRLAGNLDYDVFGVFWFGLCVITACGGILQLFYPLDANVFYVVMSLGICGLLVGARCRKFESNSFFILVSLFLLVTASFLCSRPDWGAGSLASDTDLYHFSVINWINEFPTIKGLAHLHSRLGYGTASSFFTFAALIDNSIWDSRSAWIIAPFFLVVPLIQMVHGFIFGSSKLKIYSLVCVAYLLYELAWLRPSLYFDSAVFYVLMATGAKFVKMTENDINIPELFDRQYFGYLLVPSLIALAFTIKPMAAVVLMSCFLVCWVVTFKVFMHHRREILKAVLIAVIPIVLISGYMSRNAITSGWLFFPAPIGRIDTQWTMSEETVKNEYLTMKNWAKAPGENSMEIGNRAFHEWFPEWVMRSFKGSEFIPSSIAKLLVIFNFYLPLLVSIGLFLLIMLKRNTKIMDIIPSMTMLFSLLFWFYSAPDMRFGRGIVWIFLAFTSVESMQLSSTAIRDWLNSYTTKILMFTLFVLLLSVSCRVYFRWNKHTYSLFAAGTVSPRNVEKVILKNGQNPALAVYVPISGNEPGFSPLPDTPYPNDNLCLIVPGDISKGFFLSGGAIK